MNGETPLPQGPGTVTEPTVARATDADHREHILDLQIARAVAVRNRAARRKVSPFVIPESARRQLEERGDVAA
jgi:hypothetical protein